MLLAEQPLALRLRSFKTRSVSTLALLTGFVTILWGGHVFVCLLVLGIQAREPPARRPTPPEDTLRRCSRPARRRRQLRLLLRRLRPSWPC